MGFVRTDGTQVREHLSTAGACILFLTSTGLSDCVSTSRPCTLLCQKEEEVKAVCFLPLLPAGAVVVASQLLPTSVTCSFCGLSTRVSHVLVGSSVLSAGSLYCSLMVLQLRDTGKKKLKRLFLL